MPFDVRRLIPVVVIAGLVVGGFAIDRARESKRSSLSGTFESQPSTLSSRVGGRVAKVLVKEGDVVKAGQVLIEFESTDKLLQLKALQLQAEQSRERAELTRKGSRFEDIARQKAVVAELAAQLQKLRDGSLPEEIRQAEERLKAARAKRDLVVQGARQEEITQAEASLKAAQAQLAAALRGPRPEEVAQVDARVRSAQATATQAARDADRAGKLYAQGAVSSSEAEAAQTRALTAKEALHEAQLASEAAHRGAPPEEASAAEAQVRRSRAALQELRNGARPEERAQAESDVAAAQAALDLLKRGARQEDIAAAAARLSQARAQLDALTAGNRPEEVAQARLGAKSAQAQAQGTAAQLEEVVVRAPVDGVVERIAVAVGDLVAPGAPVATFSDPTNIWLRVYLSEDRLAKVKAGDTAVLAVDVVEGDVAAKVEQVATVGEFTPVNLQTPEERGRQVFGVRLRLAQTDPRVKAGMAATVRRVGQWP